MLTVRRILRSAFNILAIIYLFASLGTVPRVFRASPHPFLSGQPSAVQALGVVLVALADILLLLPPVFAIVFGMAWWTLKRGDRSARNWALAGSIAMIVSALPLMAVIPLMWKFGGGFAGAGFTAFLLASCSFLGGVAGVAAFWRKDAVLLAAAAKPQRLAGDGTSRVMDVVAWLVQAAGYWWLQSLYLRWGHSEGLAIARGLNFWIQLEAALLAVTFLHEFAHALIGFMGGMRLISFTVGPFEFRDQDGRWRFRFRPAGFLSAGGATGIISPDPEGARWSEAAAIAAGPMANLFTGAVAAALAYAAPGNPWEPYWEFCAQFAAISLIVFLGNLIPFQTETSYSDGAHIYQLFSNGPAHDFSRAARSVMATLVSPRRPRHYDIASIQSALNQITSGQKAMILHLWAMSYHLDTGNYDQVAEHLTQAEKIYDEDPAGIRAELLYAIVIFETLLNRNVEAIRRYWNVIALTSSRRSTFYWLAKCCSCWTEADSNGTYEAYAQGTNHLRGLRDVGDNRFDAELFSSVEAFLTLETDRSRLGASPIDARLWLGPRFPTNQAIHS